MDKPDPDGCPFSAGDLVRAKHRTFGRNDTYRVLGMRNRYVIVKYMHRELTFTVSELEKAE